MQTGGWYQVDDFSELPQRISLGLMLVYGPILLGNFTKKFTHSKSKFWDMLPHRVRFPYVLEGNATVVCNMNVSIFWDEKRLVWCPRRMHTVLKQCFHWFAFGYCWLLNFSIEARSWRSSCCHPSFLPSRYAEVYRPDLGQSTILRQASPEFHAAVVETGGFEAFARSSTLVSIDWGWRLMHNHET